MANERAQRVSIANDPRARAFLYQGLLAAALIGLAYLAWRNAVANMQARGVPMGFGFWDETAGFDVNQTLIPYSALSTYGRAFWVGLLNTLLVGAVSIVLATPLGFAVGLARLVAQLAAVAAGAGLCRTDAQHAAAAATVLLVQRGAEDAAVAAPVGERRRRRLPQQSRSLSAAPDLFRRRLAWSARRWRSPPR